MADPATHDSSGFAVPMEWHNVGNACFTTVSYTPEAEEDARDSRMSVNIERKIGSETKIILD
jgi:hypothetical protein